MNGLRSFLSDVWGFAGRVMRWCLRNAVELTIIGAAATRAVVFASTTSAVSSVVPYTATVPLLGALYVIAGAYLVHRTVRFWEHPTFAAGVWSVVSIACVATSVYITYGTAGFLLMPSLVVAGAAAKIVAMYAPEEAPAEANMDAATLDNITVVLPTKS